MSRFLLFVAALAIVWQSLVSVGLSQADDISDTRYNINQSTNTETIKIGNTKTNNFNLQESNYLPTQLTQVVLNVPKLNKKLRKSRPPTVEEFAIKRRVVEVYDEAKQGSRLYMDHLGRIINALNPKYISTERMRKVAFSDPNKPVDVEAPYQGLMDLPQSTVLKLDIGSSSIGDQLETLSEKFKEQVVWTPEFIGELAKTSDEQLTVTQSAFKKLILCLSQPALCRLIYGQPIVSEFEQEPDVMETSANEIHTSYQEPNRVVLPVEQFIQQPVQMKQPEPAQRQHQSFQEPIELIEPEVVQNYQPTGYYHQTHVKPGYTSSPYETPSQFQHQYRAPQKNNYQPEQSQVSPIYVKPPQRAPHHHKTRFLRPTLRNLRFNDQLDRYS